MRKFKENIDSPAVLKSWQLPFVSKFSSSLITKHREKPSRTEQSSCVCVCTHPVDGKQQAIDLFHSGHFGSKKVELAQVYLIKVLPRSGPKHTWKVSATKGHLTPITFINYWFLKAIIYFNCGCMYWQILVNKATVKRSINNTAWQL